MATSAPATYTLCSSIEACSTTGTSPKNPHASHFRPPAARPANISSRTPIRRRIFPESAMMMISGISMMSQSHLSVPSVCSGETDLTKIGKRNIGPSSMKLARNT